MSKYYPDISHYNPVEDWKTVKENCPFLISKATEGRTFVDSYLDTFIKKCEKREIPYWLYTFLLKGNEVEQAKFLVKTCKPKIGNFFVGYILDVEDGNSEKNVKKALKYLNGLRVKTMIYTMYFQYSDYKSLIDSRPGHCAWWEARYGKNDGKYSSKYPCHTGVDLHQYTSDGVCPGIGSGIDLNRITGMGKKKKWFKKAL